MRIIYCYIVLLLVMAACTPPNKPTQSEYLYWDSVYIKSDFQHHGDYYESGHQVYAIDLLSDGLDYDSMGYIVGTGYNLFFSDIFAPKDSTMRIPAGSYNMDSVAREMTFLRGMYFEGDVTGTYLLEIDDQQIQRIVLFTAGSMTIDYVGNDTLLYIDLYTADSTHYHAIYRGYVRR